MRTIVGGLFFFTLAISSPSAHGAEPTPASQAKSVAEAEDQPADGTHFTSTVAAPVPRRFVLWEDTDLGAFVKPVLAIAASAVYYMPTNEARPDAANRASTLVLGRFGFEGALLEGVTFKLELERNIGFNIARGGPLGTSVWEGMASLQARETYIRLERWGFSLAAGIVADPASIDQISLNTLNLFGMDPYVRDPAIASGLNQGQGFVLRYTRWGVSAGVSYTAGNPLVSSLSASFGGDVSALGTLYTAPLRAMTNGLPGSNIHMQVVSPSLSYASEWVSAAVVAQLYDVDPDVTQEEDKKLIGANFRGTFRWPVLAGVFEADDLRHAVEVFGTLSSRSNQQLAMPDITTRREHDFKGMVAGGGLDLNYGDFSLGGGYYYVASKPSKSSEVKTRYLNVGGTYWIAKELNLAAGIRYSRSWHEVADDSIVLIDSDAVFGTLRFML